MSVDTAVVRPLHADELGALLDLYKHLRPGDIPPAENDGLEEFWQQALANPMLHYLGAEVDGRLAASCILVIIPNLTRRTRPYGLIENVVTHADFRRRGLGTAVLHRAMEIAWQADCYKVMLLTGRDEPWVDEFYERAGFTKAIKTGFVAQAPAKGRAQGAVSRRSGGPRNRGS